MSNTNPQDFTKPGRQIREEAVRMGIAEGTIFLGRYSFRRVLGSGNMGEVLEVRDTVSGKDYAFKRVPKAISGNSAAMERIRQNFNLVSPLTHPHICQTRHLEVDSMTGDTYLIIDLIRGETLSHWTVKQRSALGHSSHPLSMAVVIGIAEQIASALDYAHSQPLGGSGKRFGIIHRDLKPDNVMLELDKEYRSGIPFVKVVDYGLAAEIQASLTSHTRQGRGSDGSGTAVYMAPEQWKGEELTRGVDQWALACIMYELLAGRIPFNGPTEAIIMNAVCAADPAKPENMTASQWKVLKKAMSVKRRERYRSCLELVKAFSEAERNTKGLVLETPKPMPDEFAGVFGVESSSSGTRPSFGIVPWKWLAAVVLLGALVGGGWWHLERSTKSEIAEATQNAHSGAKEFGEVLAAIQAQVEQARSKHGGRKPEELKGLDDALGVLKTRKAELEQRESRFKKAVQDAEQSLSPNPELALQKLLDAEDIGRASAARNYPDLLLDLKPGMMERKSSAEAARQTKLKAEQESETSQRKALESLSDVKALARQLEESRSELKNQASSDPVAERVRKICEQQVFTGSRRAQGDRAQNMGEALIAARKFADSAAEFAKAEAALKAGLQARDEIEKAVKQEAGVQSRLASALKDKSAEEQSLYAGIQAKLTAAAETLSKGGSAAASAEFSKIDAELKSAEELVTLRREAQKAREPVAGLLAVAEMAPEIQKADAQIQSGDAATKNAAYVEAKSAYQGVKAQYGAVMESAKKKTSALVALAQDQYGKKQYAEALNTLSLLAQVEPGHAELAKLKPKIEADRDYEAAMAEAKQAIDARKWDEALAAYQRAEQKRAGDSGAQQGQLAARNGKLEEQYQSAMSDIQRQLAGEPLDAEGRYTNLSEAKRTAVEAAIKRALSVKANDAAAKVIESKLGWPLWDGRESVADYARRAGLAATKTITLNSERLELVLVPAGKFTMGSPASEEGRFDNETEHEVTLTQPFYMGKYEVTQGQWEAVMGNNPSEFKERSKPVETVSWGDVQGFFKQAGNGLKLPTEAQWEWACRAGTKTRFYTGNSDSDLGRAGWCNTGADSSSTRPVGQKQVNAFGLYDMHGNVWEWCADWYGNYPAGPEKDPAGPASGSGRVLRGGSWDFDPRSCRSAYRCGTTPDYRNRSIGFRVVMMPSSRTP